MRSKREFCLVFSCLIMSLLAINLVIGAECSKCSDVNDDKKVNIFDLVSIASKLGETKGSIDYKETLDLNANNEIEQGDLDCVNEDFGKDVEDVCVEETETTIESDFELGEASFSRDDETYSKILVCFSYFDDPEIYHDTFNWIDINIPLTTVSQIDNNPAKISSVWFRRGECALGNSLWLNDQELQEVLDKYEGKDSFPVEASLRIGETEEKSEATLKVQGRILVDKTTKIENIELVNPTGVGRLSTDPNEKNNIFIGTIVQTWSKVIALEEIKNVKVEIALNGEVIDTVDQTCSDFRCFGEWYTNNIDEGSHIYTFTWIATDNFGHTTTKSEEYKINFRVLSSDLCKELVPRHNKPAADRVNIVFVGYDYDPISDMSAKEYVKRVSESFIDFDGESYGLFSVEPFKSNRDKFNVWYIDEIGRSRCVEDACQDPILDSPCVYNNKLVTKIVNRMGRSTSGLIYAPQQILLCSDWVPYCLNADTNNDGCINEIDFSEIIDISASTSEEAMTVDLNDDGIVNFYDGQILNGCVGFGCENYRGCFEIGKDNDDVFVHEFGHQFGFLLDEYVEEGKSGTLIKDKDTTKNCYSGTSYTVEECLTSSGWSELIGDGCGKDDIIDCKQGIDVDYNVEIGCFEGCNLREKSIFRSGFNTIMRGAFSKGTFGFGLWNEKLLMNKIDQFSGEINEN